MPALITHHIFGEDASTRLPDGIIGSQEELLAFLLGNQGPDPLFARFSCLPHQARRCRRLAHEMQSGHVVEAFVAFREGVSRLPTADERVGRAFVLGLVGHYALDRTAHPFVYAQQFGLISCDPSLQASSHEVHAALESDLDSWILWEKRHATVRERPAAGDLMRTARIDHVGGALFSQVASSTFGEQVPATEYGAAVGDYERLYRAIEPAGSRRAHVAATVERALRRRSLAEASAHYVRRTDECAAANLERRTWMNPFTHEVSNDSFADLFEKAGKLYDAMSEAFARGDDAKMRDLVAGLNYEGRQEPKR